MTDSDRTHMIRRHALPFLEVKTGADTTYAVRRHSHDTLSVGFVEEGSSLISCHPLEFRLNAGDALLIPPETIHLCQPREPDRFRFRMLYISPDWLKESLDVTAKTLVPQMETLPDARWQRAADFFRDFQDKQDRFMDETNAILFLDDLLNRVFCVSETRPAPAHPSPGRMEQVRQFLDDRFDTDIQLDDLTGLAGTSKYVLLRRFKQQWQITPHAYVINKRILLAKTMLRNGHSAADTAAACGFFDQSHFIKTFKNFVGIRPADYSG